MHAVAVVQDGRRLQKYLMKNYDSLLSTTQIGSSIFTSTLPYWYIRQTQISDGTIQKDWTDFDYRISCM